MHLPPMQSYELSVNVSEGVDILEAPAHKRIAVYGFWAHQTVHVSAAVTEEARLFFGTDPADKHKRLASYEQEDAGEEFGIALAGLNIIGLIGEPITLMNAIYSPGEIKTDSILYYGFI